MLGWGWWAEEDLPPISSSGPQLPSRSPPGPRSQSRRGAAARAGMPKAPAHLEPGAHKAIGSAPPHPAAPYLNAQSGSRASRPGAPSPLLLLKSFWNSVGAMLTTAKPGSLLRALGRPPLLEPPRHPHERLSHMTEISHFKRPRRAGRSARQGRRSLAGSEPHHVAPHRAGSWG